MLALGERLLAPRSAGRVWQIEKEEPAELLRRQLQESVQVRLVRPRTVLSPHWTKCQQSQLKPEEWRLRLLPLARWIPLAASAQITWAAVRRAFLAIGLTVVEMEL